MANGRVTTGFSKPYIADYSCTSGTIAYENCMPLARGVNVDISIDEAETSGFYADNVLAESDSGVFTSGTFTFASYASRPSISIPWPMMSPILFTSLNVLLP